LTISLEQKSIEDLIALEKELETTLRKSDTKIRQLETQIHNTHSFQIEKQKEVEAEEEYITMKLIKRLEKLKTEKTELVARVEREEEYLTNTLQKKLQRLEQEKVELEQKLEIEEEYIVNKLQKQLDALREEKALLEQQLTGESIAGIELRKVKLELEDYRRKKDRQILQLQTENSELQQQLTKCKEKYSTLSTEKLELERETEILEEHAFNTQIVNSPMAPPRGRTVSNRAPRSLTLKPTPPCPSLPSLFSPRDKPRNVLKRGWFLVQEDGGEEDEQFLTLTEDAILGYESETIQVLPAASILTRINLDVVLNASLSSSTGFIITLKNGHNYKFTGSDADIWCKLIRQLLPDQ